jgi:hypothetical protein
VDDKVRCHMTGQAFLQMETRRTSGAEAQIYFEWRNGANEFVPFPALLEFEFFRSDRRRALLDSRGDLIAVVGVYVEAEVGVDFDWLRAAHGGAEFPIR